MKRPSFWSEQDRTSAFARDLAGQDALTQIRDLQDYIAHIEAQLETESNKVTSLQEDCLKMSKRMPLCPPCDMGENTGCICNDPLMPASWVIAASKEINQSA